jgi:hypothetical protein
LTSTTAGKTTSKPPDALSVRRNSHAKGNEPSWDRAYGCVDYSYGASCGEDQTSSRRKKKAKISAARAKKSVGSGKAVFHPDIIFYAMPKSKVLLCGFQAPKKCTRRKIIRAVFVTKTKVTQQALNANANNE